jgi:hypothetical protein
MGQDDINFLDIAEIVRKIEERDRKADTWGALKSGQSSRFMDIMEHGEIGPVARGIFTSKIRI